MHWLKRRGKVLGRGFFVEFGHDEEVDGVDYAAALIEQNGLLGDVIFAADPNIPIPTCPGWSMLQLLRHVGRGDRWAAHIIQTKAGADLDPRTVPDGRPPDDSDARAAGCTPVRSCCSKSSPKWVQWRP